MNKRISCGGFELDGETIVEENGILKVVGGGSGGVELVTADLNGVLDKNWNQIKEYVDAGKIVLLYYVEFGDISTEILSYIGQGVSYDCSFLKLMDNSVYTFSALV